MLMTTDMVNLFYNLKKLNYFMVYFFLLAAELTHTVCDNRLHKIQFSKISSVFYCKINNKNLFAFHKILIITVTVILLG